MIAMDLSGREVGVIAAMLRQDKDILVFTRFHPTMLHQNYAAEQNSRPGCWKSGGRRRVNGPGDSKIPSPPPWICTKKVEMGSADTANILHLVPNFKP